MEPAQLTAGTAVGQSRARSRTGSLTRLFARAADDMLDARRAVQIVGDTLEPARLALPDKALANAIAATLALLEDRRAGLARVAERLDRQARYTTDVRRLAEQADANGDGTWSRTESRTFLVGHRARPTPAERAVSEALAAGGLRRRIPAPRTCGRGRRVDRLLALAERQHAREHNGDNRTKYGAWYGNNGAPWCAQFVSWVFAHSHNPLPPIDGPRGFQSVSSAIRYARAHNQLHRTPRVGDVFLKKNGGHTGIVAKVYRDGHFATVEGNEGDQVAHAVRDAGDGSYYFWSPIR
jgi:hypothetical protein